MLTTQSNSSGIEVPGEIHSWVRRHVRQIAHERRVVQLAIALFDLTSDLHVLTPRQRLILACGALVHDVGRSVTVDGHEVVGAELIQNDKALRIDPAARRHLAYLTRYHRGRVPERGSDSVLTRTDDHDALLKMLALLRAADTLDSRALEPPRIVMIRRGARVDIACIVRDQLGLAQQRFCRPKKFRLLTSTLACEVNVEVSHGDVRTA